MVDVKRTNYRTDCTICQKQGAHDGHHVLGAPSFEPYKLNERQMEAMLAHKEQATFELDRADCEESLVDYITHFWEYVEPVRPFVRGWAIDAILAHLTAVHNGEIKRLLMNVPPGFMKSLSTDVFFPSWEWGPRNRPDIRYVCASYSQNLTVRDNLKTRLLIQSPKYQAMWGDRFSIDGDQNAKEKFNNDRTGFKLATSVHGVGTGERGDRVIVDDPHNVLEAESDAKRNSALQWFTEVMPTRVNDKKTAVFIVIMQRVHENDVAGLILEKELGYTHLCIPMHHDPDHPHVKKERFWVGWEGDPRMYPDELAFPERFDEADVAEMEKDMMSWGGTYAVAGQLEQRPEPRGGGMVKKAWFDMVDRVPEGAIIRCRGWDFAGTDKEDAQDQNPGSASVLVGEMFVDGVSEIYIEHAWWEQVSPGGLYTMIEATVRSDGYGVFQSLPQDPGQAGKYQVDDLLDLFRGYDFEFSSESGDKVSRFRPVAAQAETRNKVGRRIKVVKGDWNEIFFDQVTKFPRGRRKDIPDALSRAYGGVVRRGGGLFLVGGSTIIHQNSNAN